MMDKEQKLETHQKSRNKLLDSISITELYSGQRELVRLFSTGLYTKKDLSVMTGYSIPTIDRVLSSPLAQMRLEMLEAAKDAQAVDLSLEINALASVALEVQANLMMDKDTPANVKRGITDKMLDRAGYTPVNKNINMNMSGVLTDEDLDSIKDRAKEIKDRINHNRESWRDRKYQKAEEVI